MGKRFVGFGFGPIQAGLMLLEAYDSGHFSDFAVAEVDRELVETVRRSNGTITINIAGSEGIEQRILSGLRMYDPTDTADRKRLGEAIADADEMATALPSVDFYDRGGDGSIARLLAENLNPEKPRVLYAAENNNHAAAMLRDAVLRYAGGDRLGNVRFLDTVIGKMSGVIRDPSVMKELGLMPLTPGYPKAVLVERFNRIFISHIDLPGYRPGIQVFREKDDLIPFEEAKLYGHNAVHALLGYLAALRGYQSMSRICGDAMLLELGRNAFAECGATLVKKYGSLGDPLFTPDGFREYGDDLLARMTNPFLHDTVERICRDPARKLGPDDRLFGTMREALGQGLQPWTMAIGAAAALVYLCRDASGPVAAACGSGEVPEDPDLLITLLWPGEPGDGSGAECRRLVRNALTQLRGMGVLEGEGKG